MDRTAYDAAAAKREELHKRAQEMETQARALRDQRQALNEEIVAAETHLDQEKKALIEAGETI
jgi:uncharacterized coiled-coil DUF342 family protein